MGFGKGDFERGGRMDWRRLGWGHGVREEVVAWVRDDEDLQQGMSPSIDWIEYSMVWLTESRSRGKEKSLGRFPDFMLWMSGETIIH